MSVNWISGSTHSYLKVDPSLVSKKQLPFVCVRARTLKHSCEYAELQTDAENTVGKSKEIPSESQIDAANAK